MFRRRQASSNSSSPPPSPARPRVLFVDDEKLVLEGLRDSLRRYPFEIYSATSPDQGFEILSSVDIDVVVSDERMPGMTGSEFLALVCEMYPETVRIILSGQESPDAGDRSLYEAEVFRFVRKPCLAGKLAEVITEALRSRGESP
jgi:two-component system probable response regulator PhcQ